MRRRSLLASLGPALRDHPRELWLTARLLAWSLVLPLLKRALPLPTLVRIAWTAPRTVTRNRQLERRVVRLTHRVYGSRPARRRDGACLERSLVTYRFLSWLNADPQLVAAVRRGDGAVLGHAWVAVDGEPVAESPAELAAYTPVVVFGAGGAARSPLVSDRPS